MPAFGIKWTSDIRSSNSRRAARFFLRFIAIWFVASLSRATTAVVAVANNPMPNWLSQALMQALADPVDDTHSAALAWMADDQHPVASAPSTLIDDVGMRLSRPQTKIDRLNTLSLLQRWGVSASKFAPGVAVFLKDSDPQVQGSATQTLVKMGTVAAPYASTVAAMLKSDDQIVLHDVEDALSAMGEDGAPFASAVAALLQDSEKYVRARAAQTLGRMGEAGGPYASAVAALLKDSDLGMHVIAVQALGRMGTAGAPYASTVAALLKDSGSNVRATAAQALSRMGEAGVAYASAVAALLKDSDPSVRATAAQALGGMGEAGAAYASPVAALLKDSNSTVRATAAQALGRMGEAGAAYASAVTPLLKDHSDWDAQGAVEQTLEEMAKAGLLEESDVAALLKDSDPVVRGDAVTILGAMGKAGVTVAPAVAALLKDSEKYVRARAAQALGRMGEAGGSYAPAVATLLKDSDPNVRSGAIEALGTMGEAGRRYAPAVATLLKDSDPNVRSVAMEALGTMKQAGAPYALAVAALLKDSDTGLRKIAASALGAMGKPATPAAPAVAALLKDNDPSVRDYADRALEMLAVYGGPIGIPALFDSCLDSALKNPDQAARFRLTCYLTGGGLSKDQLLLMQWVNDIEPENLVVVKDLNRDHAIEVLTVLRSLWPDIDARDPHMKKKALNPILRRRVADVVTQIVKSSAGRFTLSDAPLIEDWTSKLKGAGLEEADSLERVRDRIVEKDKAIKAVEVIAAHMGLWVLLLWAYPYWRPVQSFFFWNRWGRRFLGLGYVGLLITFVPWLRQRMFIPFQPSLVQRGALSGFNTNSYFPDSEVTVIGAAGPHQPLSAVLPEVTGQVVLEGESGLGKTMLLLHLASTSRRIAVLLRATECSSGVVAAIQTRLKGQVRDEKFLLSLIHAGAIDVLIDGLNEATPDTRSRIVNFVEELFRGNFILTTQPMDWTRPRTARALRLQALRPDQIEAFLQRQWAVVQERARINQEAFEQAVNSYIAEITVDGDADSRLKILSNPMEASLVAELLSRDERPDLLRLIEQCFVAMENDFRDRELRPFPYSRFAEQVYLWRVSGKPYFDPAGFDAEVAMLVEHKLMIERTVAVRGADTTKDETRWWFRHDKFMEYCLLPAFMGEHADRQREHASDEAFFGVYQLLALKLPDDDELKLRDFLVEHAADTQRNDLLNRYTLARRHRAALAARTKDDPDRATESPADERLEDA